MHTIDFPEGFDSPCSLPAELQLQFFSEDTGEEDLQPDSDQDQSADNVGFTCQHQTEFLADFHSGSADEKRNKPDQQGSQQRICKGIRSDGKANRESIDGSGQALDHQIFHTELTAPGIFLLAADALVQHFSADIAEQPQGNPWNHFLEGLEIAGNRGNTDPADHRHQKLKTGISAGNGGRAAGAHLGLMQTIGHGNAEGIHSQADAQHDAVENE